MALMLEITKADGSVARTPLESQATKVAAWPGGKVRVIDTATGKAPANLTAKRVGDSLIVENLPDGKTVEITKFYTDCSPATPCALVIDPADAAQAVTIDQTTAPIATLGENQALMYGPTSSSGAAAAPAGGGLSTGAALAGLALVGVAAAAGGGGGGGGGSPTPPPDTTPPDAPVVNTVAGDGIVSAAEAAAGVEVSGTAEANSTVTVTWGSAVKTATADANGNWSVNFTQAELPATDGPSTISVTARDAADNVSSATEQTVTLDTGAPDETAPAAPTLSLTEASDSGVAGDGVTNDTTPTIRVTLQGTGATQPVAGDTVKLFLGSTEIGSAVLAGADVSAGFVDIAVGSPLAEGENTLTATITDAAGNTSEASTPLAVTIDTAAPAAPVANVAPDGVVSGTADPGSTVTMGDQTTTADADTGAYQFETPLASGASASVVATDAAGNASTATPVTAVTRAPGTTEGDDVILAGTAGFVDGGDGNDVLVGGDGGSVRNYQFEYWNVPDGSAVGFNDGGTLVTLLSGASTGWTIGTTPSNMGNVGGLDDAQVTGHDGINILRHDAGLPDPLVADDTGGGGRYAFDTVRNPTSGGTTLSQEILTSAGAQYTLSMQVSDGDYDTSLAVFWGGELLALWDSVAEQWSGDGTPPAEVDLAGGRKTWTWTVEATGDTTTLEVRGYADASGAHSGQGMMIDRVTLDAVTPDGNETLAGGAGADLLFGQEGDDTLYGGALGADPANSDSDADTFVYSMRANNGNDTIKDFEIGVDRIVLIDALDTYLIGSGAPPLVGLSEDPPTTVANSDDNLTFRDFMQADSDGQYLEVTNEGGWLKLSFWGESNTGAATALGSVVLEGVAYTGQTVESLFDDGVLVATMDGFHTDLLNVPSVL